MERCHNCGQELVEIDNRGERLIGVFTCITYAEMLALRKGAGTKRSPDTGGSKASPITAHHSGWSDFLAPDRNYDLSFSPGAPPIAHERFSLEKLRTPRSGAS